jgi:acyl carrier protein
MTDTLQRRLAELVSAASDGEIDADQALAETRSLGLLGVGSLEYLRLIQATEREFEVVFDLDGDMSYLDTVGALAARLRTLGVTDPS